MQIILLGAGLISLVVTRDVPTTIVLVLLTVFNAVLGMRGESQAEASLAALAKMMKNIVRVRRDGQAVEIEAEGLVPGDVVLMEAGNRVPADGRLFLAASLEIEEAALTGESVASPKDTEPINKPDVPLGDRLCMAFMNTAVTRGRAEMIVTTTGMGTEMGHIADLLNKTESDKTPLAETARPADHHHRRPGRPGVHPDGHLGTEQWRFIRDDLHCRHRPGDFRHPHRSARSRHHHVLHGHAHAGATGRHCQAAAIG